MSKKIYKMPKSAIVFLSLLGISAIGVVLFTNNSHSTLSFLDVREMA